jgi:hypothetical protein
VDYSCRFENPFKKLASGRATEKSEAIATCKEVPVILANNGGHEKNNWKKEGRGGGEPSPQNPSLCMHLV